MFVTVLNIEQRRTLLEAAAYLAALDGLSADDEAGLLEALNLEARLADIPDRAPTEDLLLRDILERFSDSPTAARALLLELAGLAAIDGHADAEELAFLQQVAS